MQSLILASLDGVDDQVEVVERKGLGHPDTICDSLAETFSRNLCLEYRRRFDRILHHNVDKALLCGGRTAAAFGGGTVIEPIDIYLAGRVARGSAADESWIKEVAVEGSRSWLRTNLHALDADRHVRFHVLSRPVSPDLQDLFLRQQPIALANDTSIGVGYAPMSPLEQLVLTVERHMNGRRERPAWGEDVKIMGVRCGDAIRVTVSCAMVGRHLGHMGDYLAEKSAIRQLVEMLAAEGGFSECAVEVNAADGPSDGAIYLTVTGTSAEAGDDGQVGRGNRVNGLITPCRPMSLEAAAGKNPVTHVGKIYNVVARDIAETLVAAVPEIIAAHCLMVSRIGSPVTNPAIVHVKIATRERRAPDEMKTQVENIAADRLARIPALVDQFIAGAIGVF